MSAFNGIYEDVGSSKQICSECGDEFPEVDEATELCDGCFEYIMGEPLPHPVEDSPHD
jgi:hypothetical protein